MSLISSNTLFHFTNNADTILNIIRNGFHPKFCLEELSVGSFLGNEDSKEEALPMTCFCDLPLSQIKTHLDFYGSYGVGLSKEWGKRSGLTPITYINIESTKFKVLKEISNKLDVYSHSTENQGSDISSHPLALLSELVSQHKPYEGKMWRNGKYVSKRFYDEREWRYVPRIVSPNLDYRLSKKEFLSGIKKSTADASLETDYRLQFNASDVKYLIVKTADEMIDLFDGIDTMNEVYNEKEMKVLKTKIISTVQIIEDF